MVGETKVLDYDMVVQPDGLADIISVQWHQWKSSRAQWETQADELRNYLFATDTTTTTNSQLPWKNKTTRPKLTQIRDNLHANYRAALFPHDDWFRWYANSAEGAESGTAKAITSYIKNKVKQSGYVETMSKLLLDYIDYGNCFAHVDWVNESHTNLKGESFLKYRGAKLNRISPYNIVFDVTAASFEQAGKIVRSNLSVGQAAKMVESTSSTSWYKEAFDRAMKVRGDVAGSGESLGLEDVFIKSGRKMDGFGSLYDYYQSGMMEVLEFWGDLYDNNTGTLHENRHIVVIDRSYVVVNEPIQGWLGRAPIEHIGWRERPDNLWAMGPLDNLVGMQYRIDHLENLKADVFDQIAHPVVYQRGEVEDWNWGPGERIYGDVDSQVSVLAPNSVALNADMQIRELEQQMEEMAGAPRQAMGIRTPGEKTALEVQTLENNSGRIFQHKTSQFDIGLNMPVLNQFLSISKDKMDAAETISIIDDDEGVQLFMTLKPADIQADGKLEPRGAYHYARKAQLAQSLNAFLSSPAYQDEMVRTHYSTTAIAAISQDLMDLGAYDNLTSPYVRIGEEVEYQTLKTQALQQVEQDAAANQAIQMEEQAIQEEQVMASEGGLPPE